MRKRILTILTALLMMLVLAGCGEIEIDLKECLSVDFVGADGYANAQVDFDFLKLTDMIYASSEDIDLDEALLLTDSIKTNISEIAEKKNLSNNDSITVIINWNEDIAKKQKIKFINSEVSYTVSGLKELSIVDPFENISVAFSGIAPSGTAQLLDDNTDRYMGISRYIVEPSEGLSNGDVVKVLIEPENAAEIAMEYGYTFAETEKEFTVEGLPYYVSKISEIPSELLDQMKKQSEDIIAAKTKQWAENNILTDTEFLGNYFLYTKDTSLYSDKNYCYCVYKLNVTSDGEPFSFYYYIRFYDLMIDENGNGVVDLLNTVTPTGQGLSSSLISGEAFGHGKYWFIGYEDLNAMYNYCATRNIEHYTIESNVTE